MSTKSDEKAYEKLKQVVELADFMLTTIDGEGHSIFDTESYVKNIPEMYRDEVRQLACTQYGAYSYKSTTEYPFGVASLDVHFWVAQKIRAVDETFTFKTKIGRGKQAQEICTACKRFVKKYKINALALASDTEGTPDAAETPSPLKNASIARRPSLRRAQDEAEDASEDSKRRRCA